MPFSRPPEIDWQADYRAAQAAGHHEECDGYMTEHRTSVERVEHGGGKRTYRVVCEECGPLHAGTFGQERDADTNRRGHAREVPCDGRCRDWT